MSGVSTPHHETNAKAIETLVKYLNECSSYDTSVGASTSSTGAELSFTQLWDDRDDTHLNIVLAISIKRSKWENSKQVRLRLCFEGSGNDSTISSTHHEDMLELQDSSKQLLQDCLLPCLERHAMNRIRTLQFVRIDGRLPDLINMVSRCFIKKVQRLEKVVFEGCGAQRVAQADDNDTTFIPPIFDKQVLRNLCLLSDEFHIDYEDRDVCNPRELPSILEALSEVDSLKTISLSYTFCDDTNILAKVLKSNASTLQELILYNAFSGITKSALQPLVDAMTQHPTLKKFTLLQSKLHSTIYRWAVTTILEGNANIMGICTDGNYGANATWLGRLLGSDEQLKEVNLSHPNFEDDYGRLSSPGATLSLIQGIERNSTLTSVKLIGIPLGEAPLAQAVRTLLETNDTIETFACGTNFLSSSDFSLIVGGMLSNDRLKKLSLQSVDLDLIAAQTVADVLSNNTSLQSLSLGAHRRRYQFRPRRNAPVQLDPSAQVDPSIRVASVIAEALRHNTTLQCISLPTILHSDRCMEHFSNVLKKDNTTLEHLTFWPRVPCSNRAIEYWSMLNRCKRGNLLFQQADAVIPVGLWATVLASRSNPDFVRYFCSQMPTLFDTHDKGTLLTKRSSRTGMLAVKGGGDHEMNYTKRVKQTA